MAGLGIRAIRHKGPPSPRPQMPISEGAWSVWLECVCGVRRGGWEGGGGQLLSRVRANAEMGLRGVIPFGLACLG